MVAATSDNSDYFPYEVEAGAVGIYQNEDGTYSETIGSENTEIQMEYGDALAYSAITSLQEAEYGNGHLNIILIRIMNLIRIFRKSWQNACLRNIWSISMIRI